MYAKLKEKLSEMKYRLAMSAVFLTGLVVSVSASTPLNGTINPILVDAASLFPYLVDLIVACVPLILVLAIVGFIVTLFAIILSKVKFR